MLMSPITAARPTFSFQTVVTRTKGNMSNGAEREYPVEVFCQAQGDKITIARVKGADPTASEWDQLQEEAEAYAAELEPDDWFERNPARPAESYTLGAGL